MGNQEKKLLYDILNINNYTGAEKLFENYQNNSMLQEAVERNIEIIAEATNRLLKLNPKINITNSRRIVDARNKIIHGYDEVENTQVWGIIINHLPTLQKEVSKLLNN